MVCTKKIFLQKPTLRNQLSMIFTDFLHVFTFLKLEIRLRKIFFGKSDFSPKIPNFCRIGLPLAKTYWMIVSRLSIFTAETITAGNFLPPILYRRKTVKKLPSRRYKFIYAYFCMLKIQYFYRKFCIVLSKYK